MKTYIVQFWTDAQGDTERGYKTEASNPRTAIQRVLREERDLNKATAPEADGLWVYVKEVRR